MSDDLSEQIYNQLNLRDTEDLLEIWQTNNRYEWTDVAFAHIETILKERNQAVPVQGVATFEKVEDIKNDNLKDWEIKLLEAENQPDFYNTLEVLNLIKWLDWAVKATVPVMILYNLSLIKQYVDVTSSAQSGIWVYIAIYIFVILNTLLNIAFTIFILKTLSQVLRILMEMEFNSRKV